MIEILDEPLSPSRCLEAVRRPGSGGVVTFVGAVRDESGGKRVRFLEYEAYEPMAVTKLRQIVAEASARWPVNAMAIQHRVGRLEIGEDAVVIAVSCPHRGDAFDACEYAINRLKEIVPIWKKEYGEHGEVWVEGPTLEPSSHAPAQD